MPAPVWKYFSRDPSDHDTAICQVVTDERVCGAKFSAKGSTTSQLVRHLEAKHEEEAQEVRSRMKPIKRKSSANDSLTEPASVKTRTIPNMFFQESDAALDKRITEAIITFLADSKIAFSVVGRDSFINLMKVANKRVKLKSPKTYMRLTRLRAEEIDNNIRNIIQTIRSEGDIKSVSFTTDIWTSRSQDTYMSLTVHFLDKFWHLHRLTPFVKPFPEKHTGVNISLSLTDMIQQLSLNSGDIDLTCVNDNASNMKLGIKLTVGLDQYLCDNHTLELAVGDTFKNVDGMRNVLKKCRALAKFTHQSNVALQELKTEAAREGVPFRKLKNPPDTRWSGRYENLESVLHLKKPLKKLFDDKESWEEHFLTNTEWKLVEGATKCLKAVKRMIKKLEAEKEPTINKVITEVFNAQTILRNFINTPGNCGYGIMFARELKKQIEVRFPDKGTDRVQRRMANYLDPKLRGAHLDQYEKLESTKQEIEDKIKSYEIVMEENGTEEVATNDDLELSPNSRLIRRHMAKIQSARTRFGENQNKIRKEMDRYESFSIPGKNVTTLDWWKQHEGVLPLLASLAKRILAIPASSSKSERVFSTGGNIVTAKRNRLSPKNVENLIVIKENMAMVDEFLKNSGYTIKKFDNEKTLSDVIVIEEVPRWESDQDGDDGIIDIDEEELIHLDDYISDEDSDDIEDEHDEMNDAILVDEL